MMLLSWHLTGAVSWIWTMMDMKVWSSCRAANARPWSCTRRSMVSTHVAHHTFRSKLWFARNLLRLGSVLHVGAGFNAALAASCPAIHRRSLAVVVVRQNRHTRRSLVHTKSVALMAMASIPSAMNRTASALFRKSSASAKQVSKP